jgi:hypothetical protein
LAKEIEQFYVPPGYTKSNNNAPKVNPIVNKSQTNNNYQLTVINCQLKTEVIMWIAVIIFVYLSVEVLGYLTGEEVHE